MITFHILSIFPKSFNSYFSSSIIGRAQRKKLIKIKIHNFRKFGIGRHKSVDDKPYGGGPGMVMRIEPILRTIKSFANSKFPASFVLLSPSGKQFTQQIARTWAKKHKSIVLICGHYEGIDERLVSAMKDMSVKVEKISIGPYILSGGELAAMAIVDAISRHIPGVLGKIKSLEEKRGSYPVYTRPEILKWKSKKYLVPKILLSGNHKKILEWRKKRNKPGII